MIVLCGMLIAALVAVVWLLLRHSSAQQQQAVRERRELLTRIQHPQIIPADTVEPVVLPEPEQDDSYKVGQVFLED